MCLVFNSAPHSKENHASNFRPCRFYCLLKAPFTLYHRLIKITDRTLNVFSRFQWNSFTTTLRQKPREVSRIRCLLHNFWCFPFLLKKILNTVYVSKVLNSFMRHCLFYNTTFSVRIIKNLKIIIALTCSSPFLLASFVKRWILFILNSYN